ncbi:hypothetical protein SAMN00790413_03629 [Deinococcus hopiensis KR-140]|uniref:Uncharacterized protein n=1 Tax=Deinococcus hopiensis KR-140 TaxID=695939 RepID=A0A1W1UY38_9DEIO|nr:hypothetical protein SAMN00790413_03629 [Deinococcus hopiensis KR-140]
MLCRRGRSCRPARSSSRKPPRSAWGALFFVAAQNSAGTAISGLLLLATAAVFFELGQAMRAAIWRAASNAVFGLALAFLGVVLTCGLLL